MEIKSINKYKVEIDSTELIIEYIGIKKDLIKLIEKELAIDGTFKIIRFMTMIKKEYPDTYIRILQ